MHTIMHLLPSVAAIQPNLELKTRPKQLLGSLPLVFALPAVTFAAAASGRNWQQFFFYFFCKKKIILGLIDRRRDDLEIGGKLIFFSFEQILFE